MGDRSGVMATGVTGDLTERVNMGLLATAVVVVVVDCGTGTMLRESLGLMALEANIMAVVVW